MMQRRTYYVYILTNPGKTTLYVGVTNNLTIRLSEHMSGKGTKRAFSGRYYCYNLVYYEGHQYILEAIGREKQIKRWSRRKKEKLISSMNPDWATLNPLFFID